MVYLYNGYYLAIKRDEVLIHTAMWMNLETLCSVKKPVTESHILYILIKG